ncbi:unnamed protein product [Prunus armeniaca]
MRASPPQKARARQRQGKAAKVNSLRATTQSIFSYGLAQAGGVHGLPGLAFLCWRRNWGLRGPVAMAMA